MDRAILVIRLGALGDVANTLPAVHALRRSLSPVRLGWLVEEPSHELVTAARVADEIIIFPRSRLARLARRPWRWPRAVVEWFRFLKGLRASGYACVLDFQGNLKSGILGLLAGARDRIGFARGHCREMNWLFNNIHALPISHRLSRREKNAALAQVLAPDLKLAPISVGGSPEDAAYIEEFLQNIPGDGPLVVLHPGTSAFGTFKRWPAQRFGQLAADLLKSLGAQCIVTQGPNEEQLAEEVVAASDGAAHLAPLLSTGRLIELLRRASLVIACDTGPLHIAALLQRPVVGIFGPKDPVIYGPSGTRSEIVSVEVECRPCTRRRCDDVRCIMEISVEQVRAAAIRAICRRQKPMAEADANCESPSGH